MKKFLLLVMEAILDRGWDCQKGDHQMTISAQFGLIWLGGFRFLLFTNISMVLNPLGMSSVAVTSSFFVSASPFQRLNQVWQT